MGTATETTNAADTFDVAGCLNPILETICVSPSGMQHFNQLFEHCKSPDMLYRRLSHLLRLEPTEFETRVRNNLDIPSYDFFELETLRKWFVASGYPNTYDWRKFDVDAYNGGDFVPLSKSIIKKHEDEMKTSYPKEQEEITTNTTSNNKNNTKTVKFNVGGKHYEVSRLLVETGNAQGSMLERLISERWQQSNTTYSDAIFIDRNGDNFAHILDYLRYGNTITLPVTISKDSFQKDLDYYGIPCDMECIRSEKSSKVEHACRILAPWMDRERGNRSLNEMCCVRKQMVEHGVAKHVDVLFSIENESERERVLNLHLSKYGLEISHESRFSAALMAWKVKN